MCRNLKAGSAFKSVQGVLLSSPPGCYFKGGNTQAARGREHPSWFSDGDMKRASRLHGKQKKVLRGKDLKEEKMFST